jgi:hypothetical protein
MTEKIRDKSEYEKKGVETTTYPSQYDNKDYGKKRKAKTKTIPLKNTTTGQVYGYKTIEEGEETVYPNATVIYTKRGKAVGEIYQDDHGWGCFHYAADTGYDCIDTREWAIEELQDMHANYMQNRGNMKAPEYRPMTEMTFSNFLTLQEMASKWRIEYDDGTTEDVIADDRQHAKLLAKRKDAEDHIKKITRVEINAINEATKLEDTRLPQSVISQIKSLIGKGAKDLAQAWKHAGELVHTAYHVANVKRPHPTHKGAWKQYEDLLKHGVKSLADNRGLSGDWRSSKTAFAEGLMDTPELDELMLTENKQAKRKHRIFVKVRDIGHDDNEQEFEVDADSMNDVIHSFIHQARKNGRHIHIEPKSANQVQLTVHVKGVNKTRDEQIISIKDWSV